MTFSEFMLSETGYETKTTFWEDFSIAEHFGIEAVKDTCSRAFKEWKNNIEYITELVLVLNHKIWYHYDKTRSLAQLYDTLWRELSCWCEENLGDEDIQYYYSVID